MASKLVFVSLLSVTWAVSPSKQEHEPQCYSRFDYEYKVVQKLVDLENKQREQKENNAAQLDSLKAMFEKGVENIKITLGNTNRAQDEINNELKTAIEAQVDRIKTTETELENINSTCQEMLQTLETAKKEQDESVGEMKTKITQFENQNELLSKEIEKINARTQESVIAFSTALGTLANIQTNQVIVFGHVILNVGGGYDVSSGKFTCPRSGIYMITFFIGFRDTNDPDYEFLASLTVNDVEVIQAQVEGEHSYQDLQGGNAVVVQLKKDDQVWIKQRAGRQLGSNTGRTNSFSGVLLYPTD